MSRLFQQEWRTALLEGKSLDPLNIRRQEYQMKCIDFQIQGRDVKGLFMVQGLELLWARIYKLMQTEGG